MKELVINTEFIELQNALKVLGFTQTGGEAKWFLSENIVLVNDEKEDRRGRKLYPNDVLQIAKEKFVIKNEC